MFKIFGYDNNIHRCVPCLNAKRLLDAKKQPYEFISVVKGKCGNDLEFDNEVIQELLTRLNRPSQVGLTMPQVFDPKGAHIGGFDQLREYFK